MESQLIEALEQGTPPQRQYTFTSRSYGQKGGVMILFVEDKEIVETTEILEELLGDTFMFGFWTYSCLWKKGWRKGLVTKDELELAKEYYGRMWHYAGD